MVGCCPITSSKAHPIAILTPASGTGTNFSSSSGSPALFSGGATLKFTVDPNNSSLWTAEVPPAAKSASADPGVAWTAPQLFINGRRAVLSALPRGALQRAASYFTWTPAHEPSATSLDIGADSLPPDVDPAQWPALGVTVAVATAPWAFELRRLGNGSSRSRIELAVPLSAPLTASSVASGPRRWMVFNAPGPALAAGEYRYAGESGRLSYCPTPAERARGPAAASGVVPVLETLLRISNGTRQLSLAGLALAHTLTGSLPSHQSYGPPATGALEIGPDAAGVVLDGVAVAATGNNGIQVSGQGGRE